jgi:hypothetical protein
MIITYCRLFSSEEIRATETRSPFGAALDPLIKGHLGHGNIGHDHAEPTGTPRLECASPLSILRLA